MKKVVLTVLISLVCFNSVAAIADEFRVASVDMNRMINESKQGKLKRDALQARSEAKRKELDSKKAALKEMENKLTEKKVKEDSKEADEFRNKARELARLVKDSETDLKNEYMRTTKDLVKNANKVIEQYAKKNNLSMVFDRSEGHPSAILYGASSMDITAEVLKELDRG